MFRFLANVVLLTSCIVCAGVALFCFGFIVWLSLRSEPVRGWFLEGLSEGGARSLLSGTATLIGIAASIGAALSALGLWLQKRSYGRAEGRG
jgi:hypothetical protein